MRKNSATVFFAWLVFLCTIVPSVFGRTADELYISVIGTSEGWCVLRIEGIPDNGLSHVHITRESELGRTDHLKLEDLGQLDDFTWVDKATERGLTYRYFVEFSADTYRASNTAVVYISEEKMPISVEDELFVELQGMYSVGAGQVFIMSAVPSKPGGVFRWVSLNERMGTTLVQSGNRALLRVNKTREHGPTVWRVEYALGGERWMGFFYPGVVEVVWAPVITVKREGVEHLRENPAELREVVRKTYSPGNENWIQLDAVASMLLRVGDAALPELLIWYREVNDHRIQYRLLSIIIGLDYEYATRNLWEEVVAGTDARQIRRLMGVFRRGRSNTRDPQLHEKISAALSHPDQYVRYTAVRLLGGAGDRPALDILDRLKIIDPCSGVRFMAARSAYAIRHDEELTTYRLPPLNPVNPTEEAVETARKLFAGALREVRDAEPREKSATFAVLGGGGFAGTVRAKPTESSDLNWYVEPESHLAKLAVWPEAFLNYLQNVSEPRKYSIDEIMIIDWIGRVLPACRPEFGKLLRKPRINGEPNESPDVLPVYKSQRRPIVLENRDKETREAWISTKSPPLTHDERKTNWWIRTNFRHDYPRLEEFVSQTMVDAKTGMFYLSTIDGVFVYDSLSRKLYEIDLALENIPCGISSQYITEKEGLRYFVSWSQRGLLAVPVLEPEPAGMTDSEK